MVLDPAQYLAASRALHDRRADCIERFSCRLHYLSRACRRKVLRLSWLDRVDLLPDFDHAHFARVRDAAARHRHARSGFSTPVGSTSPHRALDDADLALRLGHWGSRLHDALSLVPATKIMPVQLGLFSS